MKTAAGTGRQPLDDDEMEPLAQKEAIFKRKEQTVDKHCFLQS